MSDQSNRGTVAERLARAAHAAQELCDMLWEALHEELRQPNAERVVELSGRLAEVSSSIATLSLSKPADHATPSADVSSVSAGPSTPLVAPASPPPTSSVSTTPPPSAPSPVAPPSPPSAPSPVAPPPPPSTPAPVAHPPADASAPFVERRTPPQSTFAEPPEPAARSTPELRLASHPPASEIAEQEQSSASTKLVDEHPSATPPTPSGAPVSQIEVGELRCEEGASAWVSSVGRLLARHAEDGLPFAVLLVEIVDVAHLERSETPHDLHGIVAKVESALGRGMRATDRLSRETLGRYWLVAPETNGTGARMLAERLARLVRTTATHRGVPMEVAIGIAVCPDDGSEAPALAARADLGVYSARATGRSIAHSDPPAAS